MHPPADVRQKSGVSWIGKFLERVGEGFNDGRFIKISRFRGDFYFSDRISNK